MNTLLLSQEDFTSARPRNNKRIYIPVTEEKSEAKSRLNVDNAKRYTPRSKEDITIQIRVIFLIWLTPAKS
jgi:hypothetical protein